MITPPLLRLTYPKARKRPIAVEEAITSIPEEAHHHLPESAARHR